MSRIRVWLQNRVAAFLYIDISAIDTVNRRLNTSELEIRKLNRQVRTLQTAMEQLIRNNRGR